MTVTTETVTPRAATSATEEAKPAEAHGQQHPIVIYLVVWALLFVLSTFSYLVDYFDVHGLARWSLIILFMLLKAAFIVAIFMHMAWERLALVVAILLPPMALMVLMGMMAFEGDYTNSDRYAHFALGTETQIREAPATQAPQVAPRGAEAPVAEKPPASAAPQAPKAEAPAERAPAAAKPVAHRHAAQKPTSGHRMRKHGRSGSG